MNMKKAALLFPLLLSTQFAMAESSGIPGTIEDEATVTENAWKIAVGGGLASVPRYEGASSNRLRFAPLLEISDGKFFAGTSRGIGYDFSDDKSLQYGARITLSPYRRQNVDARLNGMGDLGNAAEFGGFLNARFSPIYLTSSIASSSHGAHIELGGGYETALTAADKLRAGLELDWANGKYMQTYFGINASQAAASGGVLTAYNATSGVKDYALKLNWMHSYSKQWFSNLGATYKQLGSSAKNSPLTTRNSMNTLSFIVGYNF